MWSIEYMVWLVSLTAGAFWLAWEWSQHREGIRNRERRQQADAASAASSGTSGDGDDSVRATDAIRDAGQSVPVSSGGATDESTGIEVPIQRTRENDAGRRVDPPSSAADRSNQQREQLRRIIDHIKLIPVGTFHLVIDEATDLTEKPSGTINLRCHCSQTAQLEFHGFDVDVPDWQCPNCSSQILTAMFRQMLTLANGKYSRQVNQKAEAN